MEGLNAGQSVCWAGSAQFKVLAATSHSQPIVSAITCDVSTAVHAGQEEVRGVQRSGPGTGEGFDTAGNKRAQVLSGVEMPESPL
jgi:hypothetical protein